jgi:hypothetical protein
MRVTRRESFWRLAQSLAVGFALENSQPLFGQVAKPPSPNDVAGVWHYRSFINNPQKVTDLNTLLFGEGDFTFEEEPLGELVGTGDFGGGDAVKFRGMVTHGSLLSVRFQGIGSGPSNRDWVYDYFGVLLPAWPNGVDKIPSIVGSVVRSAPHANGSGGVSQPGKVASFIAVKK